MGDVRKQKIKKIIVNIAGIFALFGVIWGVGRIIIHDIPTMIRGYDYVAIETEEREDYMGISHEVVTKEVKRPVSFGSAFSDLITNFMILSISLGFFITYPSYKRENE
ncbi:MAG: hypothetical protein IKL59_03905 [Clostridia bacterium]|nr:hypothetical protein [Clostridia bacterium]